MAISINRNELVSLINDADLRTAVLADLSGLPDVSGSYVSPLRPEIREIVRYTSEQLAMFLFPYREVRERVLLDLERLRNSHSAAEEVIWTHEASMYVARVWVPHCEAKLQFIQLLAASHPTKQFPEPQRLSTEAVMREHDNILQTDGEYDCDFFHSATVAMIEILIAPERNPFLPHGARDIQVQVYTVVQAPHEVEHYLQKLGVKYEERDLTAGRRDWLYEVTILLGCYDNTISLPVTRVERGSRVSIIEGFSADAIEHALKGPSFLDRLKGTHKR